MNVLAETLYSRGELNLKLTPRFRVHTIGPLMHWVFTFPFDRRDPVGNVKYMPLGRAVPVVRSEARRIYVNCRSQ